MSQNKIRVFEIHCQTPWVCNYEKSMLQNWELENLSRKHRLTLSDTKIFLFWNFTSFFWLALKLYAFQCWQKLIYLFGRNQKDQDFLWRIENVQIVKCMKFQKFVCNSIKRFVALNTKAKVFFNNILFFMNTAVNMWTEWTDFVHLRMSSEIIKIMPYAKY